MRATTVTMALLGLAFPLAVRAQQSSWTVRTARSEMTDAPALFLSTRAVAPVEGVIGRVIPQLIVRCREGELEVFVSTGSVLDSDLEEGMQVRVRYDTEEAVDVRAHVSSDRTAAFFNDPAGVLADLFSVQILRVEYRPYDATPRVARFNVSGLSSHLERLGRACPSVQAFRVLLQPITLVGEVVTFATGSPITAALVRVLGSDARTRSDSGGGFSFRLPRRPALLAVSAPGFSPETSLVSLRGALAAIESIQVQLASTDDVAPLEQIRSALLRLDRAQSVYRAHAGQYSISLPELSFPTPRGIRIEIGRAGTEGWAASATDERAPLFICVIFRGSSSPLVPAPEGVPTCVRR